VGIRLGLRKRLGLGLGLGLGLLFRVSSVTAYVIYRYSLDRATDGK